MQYMQTLLTADFQFHERLLFDRSIKFMDKDDAQVLTRSDLHIHVKSQQII